MKNSIEITTYSSCDDEIITTVPSMVAVCERCDGQGRHTNPSIDGNGITGSEMAELGHEFQADYFAGVYDVCCHECKGLRVVRVIDWELFEVLMPELCDEHKTDLLEQQRWEWESAAEIRAGA